MRYLALAEVLELHRRVVGDTGGATELRDLGSLLSALAQPRATFEGNDLYPSAFEKAAALCFSLVKNHPFVDGNQRAGHAAAESAILGVASGTIGREELLAWVREHARPVQEPDSSSQPG